MTCDDRKRMKCFCGGTIIAAWSRRGSYLTFDGAVRPEIVDAYFSSVYCKKCKLMYSLEKLDSYIPWETMFICKNCGKKMLPSLIAAGKGDVNPDFFTDAGKVQLLREMRKREDWLNFLRYIGGCRHYRMDGLNDFLPIVYITDDTGLLARTAEEFLEHK